VGGLTSTAPATSRSASAPRFDKRILLATQEYDYADPKRGHGMEIAVWLPTMQRLVREVEVFPLDRTHHEPGCLDGALVAAVDRFEPDLVVFSTYEDNVGADALSALRDRTKTLAFFWDDHWRFDSFSSRYATLYDFVVTTNAAVEHRYRALGGHPIVSQYAGTASADAAPPIDDDSEFEWDVTFVGGTHPYRTWLVDWLRRQGVAVECFGAGWPSGRVSYEEMDGIFRHSRINLNVSNSRQHDTRYLLADPANFLSARATPKAFEQIKARHFEIPMAGGFELTFYAIGLEDYLTIGKDVAIYTTPEDCLLQIERMLGDPRLRMDIARSGWARCRAEHTYERRIAEWFETVWPGE
jgi:spore maturation protein CgeB